VRSEHCVDVIAQIPIAVTVVAADPDQSTLHADSVRHQWDRWNPGVPLRTRTDIILTHVTIPLQSRDDGAGPGRRARGAKPDKATEPRRSRP